MQNDAHAAPEQLRREVEELKRHNAELESSVVECQKTIAFLRKNERRFRILAESIPDHIAWFDHDRRYLYINPAMERSLGYRPGECLGKTGEELGLPLKQVEFWADHHSEVFKNGAGKIVEYSFPSPGGTRYYHSRLTPVFGSDGAVESVIFVARDISGMRRTEAGLVESRNSLAEEQKLARLGSSTYDFRSGRMIWSDTFYRILGVSPDLEPDMELYRSLLHPDDRERLESLQKTALRAGSESRYELEYRVITPAGEVRHLAAVSQVMRDGEGRPLKATSVVQDISERKRMEEMRHENEERLRQVIMNMPVLMDAFDENGAVIAWNHESERVTGYSRAEMIHNPGFWELVYPDPEYRGTVLAAVERGGEEFRDWTLVCRDGSRRTIAWANMGGRTPIPGWSHWAIGVDVTERRMKEEEQEQLIQKLQDSLAEAKTLRGLIPICTHCKKIRDDSGDWRQIEQYIAAHSEASFSHGICPDCMRRYHPNAGDENA